MPVPATVKVLRTARASHKAWVARAEAMVNGLPVADEHGSTASSECGFGRWLQAEAKRLHGFSVFSQIEASHNVFHRIYVNVFKILATESKGLSKLFGSSAKEKKAKRYEAEMLLPKLYASYDELITLIDILEKDYLQFKKQPSETSSPMEDLQTKSFRDVSKMMDDLEKDVDDWLK